MSLWIVSGYLHAQWQSLGSPEACESVDFDSEGDTLLVLTTGGVFYSTDNGTSWLPIGAPSPSAVMEQIQIERGVLYLKIVRYVNSKQVHEVYRSEDWGGSWKKIADDNDPFIGFKQIVVKADTFYFIDQKRIHISYDRGNNFLPVIPNAGEFSNYYIHHHKLYSKVSLDNRNILLRSSDDGLTWDTISVTGEDQFICDVKSIDGVLWKVEHFLLYHHARVQMSLDEGNTWISTGYVENLQVGFFDSQPRKIIGKPGQLYVITESSNTRVYVSQDTGKTWIKTGTLPSEKEVFFGGNSLFFTSLYGFYTSHDHGETLEGPDSGPEAATVSNIAVSDGSLWILGNFNEYNQDAGNPDWELLQEFKDVEATLDGHLLAHIDRDAYVSSDRGANWVLVTDDNFGGELPYPVHYVMCAGDVMCIVLSSYEMYFSSDYGASWHLSDQEFGYLFNFNEKYLLQVSDDILTSDNGMDWTTLPRPQHPDLLFSIDHVYYANPYYYMTSIDLVLRLHKDSTSWKEIAEPFSGFQVHPPSFASHGDVLFISVYGAGVFGSLDHGQTWYPINEGLTNFRTLTLAIDDEYLYLGSDGGVWKRRLDELAVGTNTPTSSWTHETSCLITKDRATLVIPDGSTLAFNVIIYSADGNVLDKQQISGHSFDADLSRYPAGLYYMVATSSVSRIMRRVVKL